MRKIVCALAFVAAVTVHAATLCVTRQTETSLTFTFAGFGGLDYELFVAHGATDGGEDKHAWDSFEKVADIASDQTTYEYEVPAALRDGRPMRFFLAQTFGVNMAKELTHVRSTGQQWVNTGVLPTAKTMIDFRFFDIEYVHATAFFGQDWNGSRYLLTQQSNKFLWCGSGGNLGVPTANTEYRFLLEIANDLVMSANGVETVASDSKAHGQNSSGNIAVFGANTGTYLATFSFRRMRIANESAVLRDFIPAMDANGEAGLYDQLNDVFYKSQTATPLVAGAERPQSRFGRVVDSTPSLRFRRSVAIASATADSVTLSFGNPDGAAYKLYVASGAVDREGDKNAWDNFSEVATVAADATTYTYTLPAALKADGVKFRFFLVKTDGLPYASELASLTSNGKQKIRLGYAPDAAMSMDFRFGDAAASKVSTLFAQTWTGSGGSVFMQRYSNNDFYYYGISTGYRLETVPATMTDYRFRKFTDNLIEICHANVTNRYTVTHATTASSDLTLFAGYAGINPGSYRFDSMVITDGGLVVRDLVPVETLGGEGAIFDRASGEVFLNSGSSEGKTDFTKGAAVARQGWSIANSPVLTGSSSGAPTSVLPMFVQLTEDTDWTSLMDMIPSGITIDLNGHKLHLAPDTAFSTKAVSFVDGAGTLRLTVPAGETYTIESVGGSCFTAPAEIVKDGSGTLVLMRSLPKVGRLTIEAGIVKSGIANALAQGTVVDVKDGGAYDVAGYNSATLFRIAGEGPDGQGAWRNSSSVNVAATASGLELTADAKVCGSANFGLINTGNAATTCELNGHTLTVVLAADRDFWFCNTTGSSAGTVHVTSGAAYFYSTASNLPNVDFVIDGTGARFWDPKSGPKATVRSVTVKNGGDMFEETNNTYMQNFYLLDGGKVTGGGWVYIADAFVVSNETTNVTLIPPLHANGTYPRIVKKGAGTFTISNSHTESRADRGIEIFGGTVVMSTSRSSGGAPQKAISSQAVPVTIHSGGTLDMRQSGTAAFLLSGLQIDEGGTLLHNANNVISFTAKGTVKTAAPFVFAGTVSITQEVTFDVSAMFASANSPAAGETVALLTANAITASGASRLYVTGCPYDYDLVMTGTQVLLRTKTAAQSALAPIKICSIGGDYVLGLPSTAISFRHDLAQSLSLEGWNVKMTGWRHAESYLRTVSGMYTTDNQEWNNHSGVRDLALKTSPTRAGLLEGLETYCAAAEEPDFTILACGDTDVADGVADDKVFAYFTNAVTRIRAALPMTTVIACTIPGGSAELNAAIATWCAGVAEVECVDLAGAVASAAATEPAKEAAAAAVLKAKLMTLATANGKNTPSGWVRPTVTLGATNNVPPAYLDGFVRARVLQPSATQGYSQDASQVPYASAPAVQTNDIAKAGYYIELVRKDTGALQAMWIDMDAPGSTLNDVTLPVTYAQRKKQTVTKLHVWSNFGGVQQVAASDDSVDGYIEFGPGNVGGADSTEGDIISDPWENAHGFNDNLYTSGANGYGCFQIIRKFSDPAAFPAAEILFSYSRWGNSTDSSYRDLGMGTLANFGNHGGSGGKGVDWTFMSQTHDTDKGNISSSAYSLIRIEFWVKYANAPTATRADLASAVWMGATDSAFATPGNWSEDGTTPLSAFAAYALILLPEGVTQTFTYPNCDRIVVSSILMLDGTASFPEVGGLYITGLDMGATGRLSYDPVKFCLTLIETPMFAPGAKFALPSKYASATKGRFLLMNWHRGALNMEDAALTAFFDASSANGADVKVWAENFAGGGGRLWLDLNYSAPHPRVNVLCTGDSITQGYDGTYGNWRIPLMKYLAAAGYEPVSKGFWKIESNDMVKEIAPPEDWVWHAGISGQRLITKNGAGTMDAIENILDQGGDVDFVLVKLGTNDLNADSTPAAELYPVWTNFVWKVLNQKPHAKFIAGAVVDQAYNAAKDAQVVAFNTMMKNAIEGGLFPAKRVYFADLYTPCYRYDGQGNYIPGSFYAENNVHPDWYGEDKLAAAYCAAIEAAIADDPGFVLGAAETVPTTVGAENNVPAEYRAGYTRARTFDATAYNGVNLAELGRVPYAYENGAAPSVNLSRVGYYIELKRKDTALSDYHDLVRWMWVSMDAFGDRTLDGVSVPLFYERQEAVNHLRMKTNMPGIESTAADATDERGWIQFWPSTYSDTSCGVPGAPANTWKHDWNDTSTGATSGYGTMQVFRLTPGARNPAQMLFVFGRWAHTSNYELGLGNFAIQALNSINWTGVGGNANVIGTMAVPAYEVAKIEIWTASDTPADAAFVLVDDVVPGDSGAVTVRGDVRNLGEGATSATLTLEWSTDPAFATVAGSTNIGVVAETGAVSATATGLTAGQTWYFRYTSVNSANVSAASGVSDPLDYSEGVWRPQTAFDVWTSVAWLRNGAGSPVAFNPAWTAKFDGNEATPVASVQVPEAVRAEQVTVDASANYTLTGAGAIASKRLVKKGTGTLTLGAGVLADTPDIEIEAGTVKLGDDATQGAAGAAGGTITVKDGAQFDFNYNDTASAENRPRAQVTSVKKFIIEGAGPDGKGALTSSLAKDVINSPIGEVVLAGDATIGGPWRVDLRTVNYGHSITGPDDATLTVATCPPGDYGLGILGTRLAVGRVEIPETGKFWAYSSHVFDIPHGIDLYGLFRVYAANGTWNVGGIRAHGSAARIGNASGNSYVKTPITVESGATLTLDGGNTMYYENGFTNKGVIAVANGAHYVHGNLVNVGNPLITVAASKSITLHPSTVTGDSRIETSGSIWTSGRSDWGNAALSVTVSGGGSLILGQGNDDYGMPKFGKNKLSTTVVNHSGTIFFHPATSASIDGYVISGLVNNFYSQGPNSGPVVDIQATNLVFAAKSFCVGTSSGYGELTVSGADTSISATTLTIDLQDNTGYRGMLNFTDGVLALGSGGLSTPRRKPARPQFVMAGGTLRADANFSHARPGLTAYFGSPKKGGDVTVDLNGHTVTWPTGLAGGSDVTITGSGAFSSGRPGIQGIPFGKWTVASPGTVDLRNAGGFAGGLSLAENTSATIDIAGTNMVEMFFWNWTGGNAWSDMDNQLATCKVFPQFIATSFDYLNKPATTIAESKVSNGTGINYFGEFYVSAEMAGTWYFQHAGGSYITVQLDGTTAFEHSAPNGSKTTSGVALTEGWHSFLVSAYTGAANPSVGSLSSDDSIKFRVGTSGSFAPFDITAVPMRMRQANSARTSVRWRKYMSYDQSANEYTRADESKYTIDVITNSLQVIHKKFSTGVNAPLGGASARFDGYFKVEKGKAGTWTFNGKFDDRIALSVDGRRLFAGNTGSASMTLREGWHKFDIRTGDTTPSGGTTQGTGGGLTDSVGNTVALEFKVNGGAYFAFDERYVPIAYSAADAQKFEEPGLGGEIELAAGSTLTNAPRDGGFCPIYGTLKGSGTLAGPYRFTGEENCWEVTGATARNANLPAVQFTNPTKETFTGLKSLSVLFDAKPSRRTYYLTGPITGLTAADISGVAYTIADEAGNDYTEDLTLTVQDGRLTFTNSKPKGMFLIVR